MKIKVTKPDHIAQQRSLQNHPILSKTPAELDEYVAEELSGVAPELRELLLLTLKIAIYRPPIPQK